jgi:hypothetical protein
MSAFGIPGALGDHRFSAPLVNLASAATDGHQSTNFITFDEIR